MVNACDFEYDGLILSDIGYIICTFDSSGMQIVSNGSQIIFNTVSALNGKENKLVSTEYNECLKTTFQICKNPCNNDNPEISVNELRDLTSWLNRKGFYKLKFLNEDYMDIYFEGSFNISKIEICGKIYGLELEVITNRPFALHEPLSFTIRNTEANDKKIINDISDEEGYIYPHMKIKIEQNGNLDIHNALENRTMSIKNCIAGEIITLDYPIIESSVTSHKIQDDFNWTFFRIANKFRNTRNEIAISLPCTITMTYSPIAKVGI